MRDFDDDGFEEFQVPMDVPPPGVYLVLYPTSCRSCGCTEERACIGGCRWVERDLCSACAAYPFSECLMCRARPPASLEAALRDGWSDLGLCPVHADQVDQPVSFLPW